MKRTNAKKTDEAAVNVDAAVAEAPKLKWKKVGGGDFRIGHKIIKENEVFLATEAEVPKGFRDIIILLGDAPVETYKAPEKVVKPVYELVPTEAPENAENKDVKYFNVVNASGKAINQNPLTEEAATQLVKDLE